MKQVSQISEFRQSAVEARAKRAVEVRLPSGLVARLVRLTPAEIFFHTGRLPQAVAAGLDPGSPVALAPAQWVELAHSTVSLVRMIFFEPRVPEDAVPGVDILESDVEWAMRWARGEVEEADAGATADGGEGAAGDLGTFRDRERGGDAAAGGDRGDVARPAQRAPKLEPWRPSKFPD